MKVFLYLATALLYPILRIINFIAVIILVLAGVCGLVYSGYCWMKGKK